MLRLLVLAAVLGLTGCKDEPKPNNDLQVPDVKESSSSQGKGDITKPKGKK